MPENGEAEREPLRSGSYFYLSYAHSPPLSGHDKAGPDPWVRHFFGDLAQAVNERAAHAPPLAPGFFDQEIPIGSDWKAALLSGLGTAQVLVPLYSPGYFARSWPGREWECFHQRVELAGVADPLRRIVPVVWIPLPRAKNPPTYAAALEIGASEPAYAENGLQALLRLSPYRRAYDIVIDRLAARVVETAERMPIRPSTPPDIDRIESPFVHDASSAVFWIAVAAPVARAPVGRDPVRYGSRSVDWRPYPQEQSLTAYVEGVAERLDFAARVTGIEDRPKDLRGPVVVLIDPWLAVDGAGRDQLAATVQELPSWMLPVLVVDDPDDVRTVELTEVVRNLVVGADPGRTLSTPRSVTSLDEFVAVVPFLIAEAERRYLKHGPPPVAVPPAVSRHYRLGNPSPEGGV